MAEYNVTSPTGEKYKITAPDNATQEQVMSYAQQQFDKSDMQNQDQKAAKFNELNPLHKGLIGIGQSIHDIGMSAGQMLGLKSQADIDALRKKEAYMNTSTAKNVGNFIGSALPFALTAEIPGINTVTGGALLGATSGAFEPTGTGESRLKNVAIGGTIGGALTGAGNKIAQSIGNKQAANDLAKLQNATRDNTIVESIGAGYKIPPAETNPSFVNKTLESIAGKINTAQSLSAENQKITNDLAKKALGLPETVSLSDEILSGLRQQAGKAYQSIADLDPSLASDIEKLKIAKNEANAYYKLYGRSAHPEDLKKAQSLRDKANELENWIEEAVTNYGKPNLLQNLRNARQQIAKTYEVENALNNATGNVNARSLAKAFNKDAPLTDELRTIGQFGAGFPKYTQPVEQIGTPGVSKAKAMMSALLGGGGAAAGGPVGGVLGATIPFVMDDVAKYAYLKGNALPSYATSKSKILAKKLLENKYTKPIASGLSVQQLIDALSNKE